MLLQLAIGGAGILRLSEHVVARSIHEGLLQPLLQDVRDPETYPLFALLPPGHHQAPKVRAFIDFLIERLGSAPWRTGVKPSRFVDRPPAGRVGQDRIDGRAGPAIDEDDAGAFRREVLVAPGQQRNKNGTKIAAARGRHIFIARRMIALAAAFEQSGLDQRIQSPREHVRRDAEALLKLVEARHPVQGVAHDEHAPPLTHALQAAGDRTRHLAKAFEVMATRRARRPHH